MDGKGRYSDNIFLERLWRTVKYEEVYLKAYASVLEAQRGLEDYFRFTTTRGPVKPPGRGLGEVLGYRTPAEVFHGGRELKKRSLAEGGVHPAPEQNYWEELRCSHLTPP